VRRDQRPMRYLQSSTLQDVDDLVAGAAQQARATCRDPPSHLIGSWSCPRAA
jgi:hypothetical protein